MAKTKKNPTSSKQASFDVSGAFDRDLRALLGGADAPIFSETLTVIRDASALVLRSQKEARQRRQEALKERSRILAEGLRKRAASLDDRLALRMQEVTVASKEKFILAGRVFDAKSEIGFPSVQVQLIIGRGEGETAVAETQTDDFGYYRMELEKDRSGEANKAKTEPLKEVHVEVLDEQEKTAFRSPRPIAVRPGKVTFVDAPVDSDRFPRSLEFSQDQQRRIAAEIAYAQRALNELESGLNIRFGPKSICR